MLPGNECYSYLYIPNDFFLIQRGKFGWCFTPATNLRFALTSKRYYYIVMTAGEGLHTALKCSCLAFLVIHSREHCLTGILCDADQQDSSDWEFWRSESPLIAPVSPVHVFQTNLLA